MSNFIQNLQNFTEKPIVVSPQKVLYAKIFGKVAVLFGGRSAERAISLISGENIINALKSKGVDAHGIDVDQNLANKLIEGKYDRVFIALHGGEGESGIIQGLLQMLNLPYTGSGVAASALAMDKARAKLVMKGLNIPTLPFGVTKNIEAAQTLAQKIGFPVAVKPVAEGSSIGVTRVATQNEIPAAYAKAAQYGEVLIEKWIDGSDYTVGILREQVLPSIEIRTPSDFYDYQAKYGSPETQYLCPSPLSEAKENEIRDLAYRAFCALGCSGWGRVDLVQDQSGHFWVLEVNTIPGMTLHSLVPTAAKALGLSFDALVLTILSTTLAEDQASKIVSEFAQV